MVAKIEFKYFSDMQHDFFCLSLILMATNGYQN
jgi:hypothetical protein